nr:(Fe-S)-binding protein [Desulfitobacterium hafniense]
LVFFNNNTLIVLMELFWWVHFLLLFSFFYIIPRSKHLHLVFAPFNVYWHSMKPKGALLPVDLDREKEQTCGVKTVEDFTWKQLFDAFSCVKCGRCHGRCPSEQSGEFLKPKRINGRLRTYMEENGSLVLRNRSRKTVMSGQTSTVEIGNTEEIVKTDEMVNIDVIATTSEKVAGGMFHYDFIWSCTTCGGCNEACPVAIDHISKIIDMRRNIVSEKVNIPVEIKQVFEGIENCGNPYGKARQDIEYTWAQELKIPTLSEKPDAEYLFFVGCQATFDESARKAAVAFARILQSSGIDFAILGEKEWCCGETVRRMGNELLFQKTVIKNIASLDVLGVKKIVTTCPHCFNTLKNEYPQFGGYYEVIPHSVLLADLLRKGVLETIPEYSKGRLKTEEGPYKNVTYHDPCYLSHFNGFYSEPREILSVVPGLNLVEMPRTKEKSFCCGAGGGRFWTKAKPENPISRNRVQEALVTGADLIITSCPYCNTTLKEETQQRERDKDIITIDIAEFLESYLVTQTDLPDTLKQKTSI